jgi:hypothetical protein
VRSRCVRVTCCAGCMVARALHVICPVCHRRIAAVSLAPILSAQKRQAGWRRESRCRQDVQGDSRARWHARSSIGHESHVNLVATTNKSVFVSTLLSLLSVCVCVLMEAAGGDFSVKLSCCCRTILPSLKVSPLLFQRCLLQAVVVCALPCPCGGNTALICTEAIDGNPSSAAAALRSQYDLATCRLFSRSLSPSFSRSKIYPSSWPPLTHRRLQIGRRVQA